MALGAFQLLAEFKNINQDNHRTIRFYERHGFTIERELVNQYENGHTIVDLEMKRRMGVE